MGKRAPRARLDTARSHAASRHSATVGRAVPAYVRCTETWGEQCAAQVEEDGWIWGMSEVG
jgi:hypothetical protein